MEIESFFIDKEVPMPIKKEIRQKPKQKAITKPKESKPKIVNKVIQKTKIQTAEGWKRAHRKTLADKTTKK